MLTLFIYSDSKKVEFIHEKNPFKIGNLVNFNLSVQGFSWDLGKASVYIFPWVKTRNKSTKPIRVFLNPRNNILQFVRVLMKHPVFLFPCTSNASFR